MKAQLQESFESARDEMAKFQEKFENIEGVAEV
jgi:hypothetical protein